VVVRTDVENGEHLAERSTWRAVVEELQTRERDGTFAPDWIEPRYVEYLIDEATRLRAG
jgi:hypothetical protein